MNQQGFLHSIIMSVLGILTISFLNMCTANNEKTTEPTYDSDLVGNWELSKISWSSESEVGSYSQVQLDSLEIIWDLNFNSDKTAEQITNISGSLTTQTGTWLNAEDKLTLSLEAPTTNQMGILIYTYFVENLILTLNWSLPAGTEFHSEFIKQ